MCQLLILVLVGSTLQPWKQSKSVRVAINHVMLCVLAWSIPVAQQEAQRAQFLVDKAKQERQEKVVKAEGEAKAATLISFMYTDH